MEDPMCDFSLESYGRRLAREGETYKVARFPSGTMGLAPMCEHAMPVCVPYDTQLVLDDIPQALQDSLAVGRREEVIFARMETGPYFDGVRFSNGREVSLQRLMPGIRATVTALLENQVPLRAAALI
jgi:hypothetical protein